MANTTTTQGSTQIPSYIQQPTKNALGQVENYLGSADNYVYGSKPGESLYTPLSTNQNKSIGNVSWLADQDLAELFGTNKASGLWDQYTNTGAHTLDGDYSNAAGASLEGGGVAGQVSGDRVIDENGYLGKISNYMNPYLQQVLDPVKREADDQLARDVRSQGANMQMSGAFGDARHGIADAKLYDDKDENVMDFTGRAYSDAYNNAMGLRTGDLQRQDARDVTNLGAKENSLSRGLQAALAKAGFASEDIGRMFAKDSINQQAEEAATDRLGVGAQAASSLGQQYKQDFMDVNDALYNAGSIERDAAEGQRSATQQFQEAIKNKRYDDALKLLGAAQGAPYPTNTTSTGTTKSNDGLAGLIGAGLGGIFA